MKKSEQPPSNRLLFRTWEPGKRKLVRRVGVTPTENELGALVDRTFLSLWSYPGPYRGQFADGKGDGKELCDLLVVFENHVVIFSDKSVEYNDSKDSDVAWPRWFKRAVEKSAGQIFGAERWIKEHPDKIFLDSSCTQAFPVSLPSPEDMKVHRIVVARGAKAAAQRFFGGSSGSLMVTSEPQSATESVPFLVGQVKPEKGFVHVLDDVTLEILLSTLDTVRDFVSYLERKERLFNSGVLVSAAGEEELLGQYMRDVGPDGWPDFNVPANATVVNYAEGNWESLGKHPQRKRQLEEDKISYLWDALIERFAEHIIGDTQYSTVDIKHPFESEEALRFLAREPRTRRRMLSRSIVELAQQTSSSAPWKARLVLPSSPEDPLYVLLIVRRPSGLAYSEYRDRRAVLLRDYVTCAGLVEPNISHIVGIAMDHPDSDEVSEDLVVINRASWTSEDVQRAERIQSETGYLKNLIRTNRVEKTYPDVPTPESSTRESGPRTGRQLKGRDRNLPCPCGSGKKYKRCCGKR